MKESYLARHIEPVPENREKPKSAEEVIGLHSESIRRPFNAEIEYGERGTERIELKNGWVLTYKYEALGEKDRAYYSSFWSKANPKYSADLKNGKFRRLTDLWITDENGQGLNITKQFRLYSSKLFFAIDHSDITESVAEPEYNTIFSYAPPNSFLGLMIMLHEIGHVVSQRRERKRKEFGKAKSAAIKHFLFHAFLGGKKDEFQDAAGTLLQEERDAWAVAVSALRKIIGAFDVSKEDFTDAIHKIALTSQSEKIRKLEGGVTFEDAKKFALKLFKKKDTPVTERIDLARTA